MRLKNLVLIFGSFILIGILINFIFASSVNVALNKPTSATKTYSGGLGCPSGNCGASSFAVDGNVNTWWSSGNYADASLTIDLLKEYQLNSYTIKANGLTNAGTYGSIHFLNAAGNEVAAKSYSCPGDEASNPSGGTSYVSESLSPSVLVKTIRIDGKSKGCNNCWTGDWINVAEFEAYCTSNCAGKECGDNGCGGQCGLLNGACPSISHGSSTCNAGGTCEVTCDSGFADCNGDNVDGCEADLTASNTCGSCGVNCNDGKTCTTDSCTSGTCTHAQNCPIGQGCNPTNGNCMDLGTVYWSDMLNNQISSADLNDTVKLMVNIPNILDKNIDFSLFKKGALDWNPFNWLDHKVAQFSDIGYTTWKASEAGEYYFSAQPQGYGTYNSKDYEFGILTVSEKAIDTPPLIIIVSPKENNNYTIAFTGPNAGKTNPIPFKAIVIDPDDDIDVVWNFGDGNTTSSSNCLTDLTTNNNCNTTHQYSIPGTKIINATAIETTRTNIFATNLTRIFIYNDSLVLFLIIDSPNYRLRSLSGPFRVSAKSTHVANCTDASLAECQVSGKPCYTIVDSDIIPSANTFYCYRYADSCNNKFAFTWNFDGQEDTIHKNCTEFTKFFPESADHRIGLTAVYKVD